MTRIRKAISALVAAAVTANAASFVGMPTRSAVKDFDATYKSIIDGCLGYVSSQANEDGSVGDARLVNDTADALYIYNIAAPDTSTAAWNTWAYANNQQSQTDGMVDARDASKMLAFYSANSVNIESDYVTEKNMEYLGDLNGDGKVDSADASYALAEYSKSATE